MALRTKCIKHPLGDSDGWRISVMSHHTLDDGITHDPDITPEMYDEHCTRLSNPLLVGPLKRNEISWGAFEERFLSYLKSPNVRSRLHSLVKLAETSDVTILCVEETPEHCHRRLIAEACKEINPQLEIIIE
jgi:uncharacterized protein YeaO (DUF488 family)